MATSIMSTSVRSSGLLLLLLCSQVYAQGGTSTIERDDSGNVIVTVPQDAKVFIKIEGESDMQPVITEKDLADKLSNLETKLRGELQKTEESLRQDIMMEHGNFTDMISDLQSNVSYLEPVLEEKATKASAKELALRIDELESSLGSAKAELQEVAGALAEVDDYHNDNDACLKDVTAAFEPSVASTLQCPKKTNGTLPLCPELSFTKYGTMRGAARTAGAHRSFKCDEGFKLKGTDYTICQKDLTWSSPAPECIPLVTCKFTMDNFALGVWIDGTQISYHGQNDWRRIKVFQFSADVTTIAVRGQDNEQGCSTGGFSIACSSVGETKWKDFNTRSKTWRGYMSNTNENLQDGNGNLWYEPEYSISNWAKLVSHDNYYCTKMDGSGCPLGGSEGMCQCDYLKKNNIPLLGRDCPDPANGIHNYDPDARVVQLWYRADVK